VEKRWIRETLPSTPMKSGEGAFEREFVALWAVRGLVIPFISWIVSLILPDRGPLGQLRFFWIDARSFQLPSFPACPPLRGTAIIRVPGGAGQ
jgi:hypothetical protein